MSRWRLYLKRLHVGPYGLAAFAIIACAVGLRIYLVANHWPVSTSDEGTFGIEAMDIAFLGKHPIFMYGQNYMGVLEAYIGALLFRLFGVSLFTLRLGMILLFALFFIGVYLLVSLLYTKRLALVTLALLSMGAVNVIWPQLGVTGGSMETLLFGAFSLLLASWLALTAGKEQRQQKRWKRRLAYACWGLVVGLGLWSHILVAPFLLAGGLILLVFCCQEWRTWAIPCIIVGLLIGGFPLVYYNLTVPLSQNTLVVALSIQGGQDPSATVSVGHVRLLQHFVGTFLYSLPVITGFIQVCNLNVMPVYGQVGPTTFLCVASQGGWSLVYMLLLLISTAMAIVPLRQLINEYRSHPEAWTEEQRQAAVIHFARLMLIFAGAVTIFFFLTSPLTAAKPWSTRYLIGLLVVLPAVIWPLWNGIRGHSAASRLKPFWMVFRYALLVLIAAVYLGGTIVTFQGIPAAQASYQSDMTLVHDLEQRGITRFYSEYWTCYRLVFYSSKGIICSVVDTNFKPAVENRIPSYEPIVAADPRAAYVFPPDAFSRAADHNPAIARHYHRFVLDGYVVYEPQ